MTVRVYIFAQKQEYMTIIEFINRFSDEESCKLYYRDIRQKEGVICKKCGCKRHYWLKNKWQFQCSNCNFRTTLRSGTVMENSRLPFRTWFLIMLFMTSTKKGISACEMHISEKSSPETTVELLKWIHIAISNAKRNLLGVYHSVKGKHLQGYLNEFCYKLNRRFLKSIFERLVVASVMMI